MPYYKITVTLKDGSTRSGIREDAMTNIDLYHRKAERKAITAFTHRYESIEVSMLSSFSKEVHEHLQKTGKRNKPQSVVYQPPSEPQQPFQYGLGVGYRKHGHKY